MKNKKVFFAIFLTIIIFLSMYYTSLSVTHESFGKVIVSKVYVNYAGFDPKSSYSYSVLNGSPAHIYVKIEFQANVSSNISYVYVTTPQFKVANWTYTFGNYTFQSGPINSTFIGSIWVQNLFSTNVTSYLNSELYINIISLVRYYNGLVSVHVVFTGIPLGAVY